MKKTIIMIIVAILLINCGEAFADEYEKPILFRDAEWGISYPEVQAYLPDGVRISSTRTSEYWHPMKDVMYNENGDYYKAELGCYSYVQSSSKTDLKVAGYDVENIYLYFLYDIGQNGMLIKDDDHTSLIYAYYKLEPKDPEAVYSDLVTKLTSLYGDVDLHQKDSPYISYEQNLWYGANGTMVSVVKESYPSGSDYIYIKYGISSADEQIAAAYNAVVLEETQNAASSTDGL